MRTMDYSCFGTESIRAESIIVFRQQWTATNSYSYLRDARPDSGLLLVLTGNIREYLPDGRFFDAKPGELISLPRTSHYRSDFSFSTAKTSDLLINFRLFDRTGEELLLSDSPQILLNGTGVQWRELFERAESAFSQARGQLRLTACFYEILEELRTYFEPRANAFFSQIAKGVEQLENQITQEISVAQLADACGVSESTFRRLFRKYAGVSPVEYRERIRISLAKRLLSGRELTVQEISSYLGFYDSSYFCRVFKEKTGLRPSEYQKLRKENPK